jgi:hypothetical protein
MEFIHGLCNLPVCQKDYRQYKTFCINLFIGIYGFNTKAALYWLRLSFKRTSR